MKTIEQVRAPTTNNVRHGIAIVNLHTAKYEAQQIGSKINATQKEIGARKKVGYWKSTLGSTPYMAYTFLGRRKKMLVYSSLRKPS